MSQRILTVNVDLSHPMVVHPIPGIMGGGDRYADIIRVLVYQNGEPVTLSGTVTGYVMNRAGDTFVIDGVCSGNGAQVQLIEEVYELPGPITIAVRLVNGDVKTTLAICSTAVKMTATTTVYDPGDIVPDLDDVRARLAEVIAATNAANSAAAAVPAMIATTFSTSTAYVAGQTVYYNGALYRFTANHAAGAWTGADAVQIVLGDEVGGVKSDVNDLKSASDYNAFIANGGEYTLPSGAFEQGSWSYSTKSANTKRIRCKFLIPVKSGTVVTYVNPTLDIYIGRLATESSSSYAQQSGWVNPQEDGTTFKASGDGYLAVILRGHNNEDITPSNYDCTVSVDGVMNYVLNENTVRAKESLPDGTDLNEVTNTGFFFLNSAYTYDNLPDGVSTGLFISYLPHKSSTAVRVQRIWSKTGSIWYTRYHTLNGWGDWNKELTIPDIEDGLSFPPTGDVYTVSSTSRLRRIGVSKSAGSRIYFGLKSWDGPALTSIRLYGYTDASTSEMLTELRWYGETSIITVSKDYVDFAIGLNCDALSDSATSVFLFGDLFPVLNADYFEKSPHAGKYISLLGASISTFDGYIPTGNSAYYPHETSNAYPVINVHDTYWMKTIDALGLQLLVNNASAGSYCTTGHGSDAMAGCGDRCEELHSGSINPDIIVIQLGGNDFTRNTELGSYDGTSTTFPTDTSTFREAYAIMLKKISVKYPLASVYCGTIPIITGGTYVSSEFPAKNTNGVLLESFNDAIRELASLFGYKVVEFAKCGIHFQNKSRFMQDASGSYGQHPNRFGHSLMANELIRTIDPSYKNLYGVFDV